VSMSEVVCTRDLGKQACLQRTSDTRGVLAEYESYFNEHRPHRALHQASPLRALPDPIDADITVTRRDRIGGLLHEHSQVA
jgi:putative transposase